jgi:WD40 repeat protein
MYSGDREGTLRAWDINTCQNWKTMKSHKAQITAMDPVAEFQTLMTGSLDGQISLWDMRSGEEIQILSNLHPGGAINSICHSSAAGLVITAGADRAIKVLEPRKSFGVLYKFTDHKDFVSFDLCRTAYNVDIQYEGN